MTQPYGEFSASIATPVRATRTACVQVPQWPLVAALEVRERAGHKIPDVCALMDRHRVYALSTAAARAGVNVGMKKRAAQAVCPEIVLLERDRDAEWSVFEQVAGAVDTVASGVESLAPGTLLMQAQGPARHAGGEEELAQALVDAVANLAGWECMVGIADGPLAAILAALMGRIIVPGESARFLAPYPLTMLTHAPLAQSVRFQYTRRTTDEARSMEETIDLLQRLGLSTLGDFAALPAASVCERFGPQLALAHLLCRGGEPAEPPRERAHAPVLVERTLDPPLERVDQAAFVARPMAEELAEELRRRGSVCTRLRIVARSEHGDEMERTWRHDGALSSADVVDRVRWQCDAWICSASLTARKKPEQRVRTGALVHLQLIPLQLMGAALHAPGLWGHQGEKSARAERALTRVQSIAGEYSVLVPHALSSGRLASQNAQLTPFRSARAQPVSQGPWPGSLPLPLPATVFTPRPPVMLHDGDGAAVRVNARGLMTSAPATLTLSAPSTATELREGTDSVPAALAHLRRGTPLPIAAYGLPLVIDQQWWAAHTPTAHRGARLHIVLEDGLALALLSHAGQWEVEALYD